MEKGSQGTALGLGSGGPKPTGEGRFLNVGLTSHLFYDVKNRRTDETMKPPHGERELG